MDLYAENILDHYRSPRMSGTLPSPTATHHELNASCGDDLTLDLLIEHERITDVRWRGQGCAISQAAMSMLSETLPGMKIDAASLLEPEAILKLLGVTVGPRRMKCALLGLHTLKNALRSHKGLEAQSWLETTKIDKDE